MLKPLSNERRALLILLGITLAAGLLRFAWIGRPCIWGDEALVYWRTCGTFGDLLQPLHEDGFPPLHYELFWVIVHALGRTPGPAIMRGVAATCGTLTVPAVYFLARQLLPRRTALTAAAFTACSAFALFYSRDAKMYAEAWFAMTVSVGCLLWWFRTGRSTAWLGWVAAGAAAGGLQTLAMISVLGLWPLMLLTQRRAHWRQTLLCLAGTVLIVAGPIGYYARFNSWTQNVDDHGWGASGIAWVAWLNAGRTGPDQGRYLATTFLTGWEWGRLAPPEGVSVPRRSPLVLDNDWFHWKRSFVGMPLRRAWGFTAMALSVVAVLAAGLLPWRTILALAGHGQPDLDAPEPTWRAALWLTAWIALPLYGFYCRSVAGFAAPFESLGINDHARAWIVSIAIGLIAIVVGLCFPQSRRLALRWLQLALVFAAIIGAGQGLAMGMAAAARAAAAEGHAWQSVWVPRYLGFVWPAVAVLVGVLIDRLPGWPTRAVALAVVLAVNLGMFGYRLFGSTEPPVDRMAADVWAAQPHADGTGADTLTWTRINDHSRTQAGPGMGNLYSDPGRYYLQLLANRPMSPTLFKQSLATFRLNRGGDPVRLITPGTQRVIVWEEFPDPPKDDADELLEDLPGWQRSAEEPFAVRSSWSGQDQFWYRRREYRRSASTRP